MRLNKSQLTALKRVFDRGPIWRQTVPGSCTKYRVSFLEFRRGVQGYPGGDCVLVHWCGMWLGIEKDGYVHS